MTAEISRSASQSSGAPVDTIIERIAERLGTTVRASTVYGEPVEQDGLTVIPVAKARWGFGGSGGTGQDEHRPGGGGGGGVTMAPVGYIEISNGQSAFRPIRESRSLLPYVAGATALLMLSLRMLGNRSSHGHRIWTGFRR